MTDATQQHSDATKMPTDTGAIRLAKVYAQAILEAADRKSVV